MYWDYIFKKGTKKMTTIYLIRHAEAEGNLYRIAHGQYNANLTPFGFNQLQRLQNRFKDIPIDAFYSSDLTRAFLTADCIAQNNNQKVTCLPQLREMHLGVMENRPFSTLPSTLTCIYKKWYHYPANCSVPCGETPTEAANRIEKAIFDIAKNNDNKTIVIASHGMVIGYFLRKVLKVHINDGKAIGWCDNTAVSKLTFENNEFKCEFKNDDSHLLGLVHPFISDKWEKMTSSTIKAGSLLNYKFVENEKDMLVAKTIIGETDINPITLEKSKILICYIKDEPYGVCLLEEDNDKYITTFILTEEIQHLGFMPQLFGQAVMYCRANNKKALSTWFAKDNIAAKKCAIKLGFNKVKENSTKENWEFIV